MSLPPHPRELVSTTTAGVRLLSINLQRVGFGTFLAVLLLRVGIGFHFFSEGAAKIRDPKPYSAMFLGNAKGHLAPFYKSMVWDSDGLARLDAGMTEPMWDEFRERSVQHYGFDEGQAKRAQTAFDRRASQLKWWLDINEVDILEYKNSLARREKAYADESRMKVVSLRGQVGSLEREITGTRRELVAPIDVLWAGLEEDMFQIASTDQRAAGRLPVGKPGRRALDSEAIDSIIRYFDVIIGALLIVGLFTRPAALLAAIFLGSVIASQWPGSYGAVPVWPQFIEMLGLVLLAAIGAGRFAGLDYILGTLRVWCCPPKQGN